VPVGIQKAGKRNGAWERPQLSPSALCGFTLYYT
jgi:hypothetical protein